MRFRVGAEHKRRVVGNVQPLVRVRDPGVCSLDAVNEVAKTWTRSCPQAEGPVDVEPSAVLCRYVRDLVERIERAGVDLSRLRTHDRRTVASTQRVAQRGRLHASLVIRGDNLGRAEAKQAHGAIDRHVSLRAHDDANARPTGETVAGNVPTRPLEHTEARSSERGDAAHLCPRDDPEGRILRQTEEAAYPFAYHLLDDRCGRSADIEPGILIPGRRQPVRGECCRQATADHEAEVAAARHRHDSGVGGGREFVEHTPRVGRPVR